MLRGYLCILYGAILLHRKNVDKGFAKYVKEGHKVKMIERGELEMGKCKCVKQDGVTAANQLSLFENGN